MAYDLEPLRRRAVPEVVQGEVVDLLRERDELGRNEYGESLTTWNGRPVHRDLIEELADALQYAVQARLEREDLEHELRALRAVGFAADDYLRNPDELHRHVLSQALRYWLFYGRVPA